MVWTEIIRENKERRKEQENESYFTAVPVISGGTFTISSEQFSTATASIITRQ